MASTGLFPTGREFLNAEEVAATARITGVASFDGYMRLLSQSAAKAGRLVVKAGAEQLRFLKDWGYLDAFPEIHFAFCRRQDHIAQGVSFALAEQSGSWASWDRQKVAPKFDANLIESKIMFVEESEKLIAEILDQSKHPYSTIWYEEMEADLGSQIASFGAAIGLELKPNFAAIRTGRQYSAINRAWVRRLVALREYWPNIFGFELLEGRLSWDAAHLLIAIWTRMPPVSRPLRFSIIGPVDLRILAVSCELAKKSAVGPPEVYNPRGGQLTTDAIAKLAMLYDADTVPVVVDNPPQPSLDFSTLVSLSIDLRTEYCLSDFGIAARGIGRNGIMVVLVSGVAALSYDPQVIEKMASTLDLPLHVFATIGETHFVCHMDMVDMSASLAGDCARKPAISRGKPRPLHPD
ncbi:Stf0 family sulfotransferase [Mesorhizobium sp. M0053]|uniref:Stf0 family sulfotransferase n=1 Tax=Mesorhizobium sp. M0053 TaxID=2956864 RepID=UPI00333A0985